MTYSKVLLVLSRNQVGAGLLQLLLVLVIEHICHSLRSHTRPYIKAFSNQQSPNLLGGCYTSDAYIPRIEGDIS
ncbi:hypothetical protein [Nodularia sp. UHCC 0506]|uniref:hypothetical protein n=1 Tax=Nodularia sp. UHCC 0506 TaxID=3110243 RepID=UPI002B20048F|nr:hypothetical protein [Nodularia sp. UHCC 0506]MEA5514801.1 hypothetical protein [Nodularia sp. UHCC 0506]